MWKKRCGSYELAKSHEVRLVIGVEQCENIEGVERGDCPQNSELPFPERQILDRIGYALELPQQGFFIHTNAPAPLRRWRSQAMPSCYAQNLPEAPFALQTSPTTNHPHLHRLLNLDDIRHVGATAGPANSTTADNMPAACLKAQAESSCTRVVFLSDQQPRPWLWASSGGHTKPRTIGWRISGMSLRAKQGRLASTCAKWPSACNCG
mmetsp:Transcript_5377/g.16448  ORF Transcript_5377/g.16448 Transcript_5377/m.16448 type:complete len:208 (+) Transcript_5377:418-1041(+)|eukprot:scaffold10417_cov33-Tisochrysis_lutea.AAC.1